MQSKKKFNTLLPTLKKRCCFLKFIDFEPIVKYGSIFIILVSIFIQSSNIIQNKNLLLSIFSLFFNLFFLLREPLIINYQEHFSNLSRNFS